MTTTRSGTVVNPWALGAKVFAWWFVVFLAYQVFLAWPWVVGFQVPFRGLVAAAVGLPAAALLFAVVGRRPLRVQVGIVVVVALVVAVPEFLLGLLTWPTDLSEVPAKYRSAPWWAAASVVAAAAGRWVAGGPGERRGVEPVAVGPGSDQPGSDQPGSDEPAGDERGGPGAAEPDGPARARWESPLVWLVSVPGLALVVPYLLFAAVISSAGFFGDPGDPSEGVPFLVAGICVALGVAVVNLVVRAVARRRGRLLRSATVFTVLAVLEVIGVTALLSTWS